MPPTRHLEHVAWAPRTDVDLGVWPYTIPAVRQLVDEGGESFLAVLRHRFNDRGVYFLDEPESALSFQSCLALLTVLDDIRAEGSQVILATHSPVLAALPGATIVELGDWGQRRPAWADLDLVQSWRDFLNAPQRWLRHLLPGSV